MIRLTASADPAVDDPNQPTLWPLPVADGFNDGSSSYCVRLSDARQSRSFHCLSRLTMSPTRITDTHLAACHEPSPELALRHLALRGTTIYRACWYTV